MAGWIEINKSIMIPKNFPSVKQASLQAWKFWLKVLKYSNIILK